MTLPSLGRAFGQKQHRLMHFETVLLLFFCLVFPQGLLQCRDRIGNDLDFRRIAVRDKLYKPIVYNCSGGGTAGNGHVFPDPVAKGQIRIAFEQSQKEVDDLRQRTREGMETAKMNGKQIGQRPGSKLHVKKSDAAKKAIQIYSKDFGGSLSDKDVMKLAGISPNTYYKYKAELRNK